MKKAIFMSLFLAGCLNSYAQKFNAELRVNPANTRELEVVLKPASLTAPVNIQQIVFTIQWPASCGVTLGALTAVAPIGTSSGLVKNLTEVTNAGVVSQMFFADGSANLLTLDPSYVIARVPIVGTTSGCTFTIPYTYNSPSGDWFMFGSNNGNTVPEMHGSITNNATSLTIPIELLSFEGDKSGEKTLLKWVSLNEKSLAYYAIEHSKDGLNFKTIDFQKPTSKSETEKVSYNFTHDKPDLGINYYRLQMKDSNENVKYSKVIGVDFGSKIQAKTYPNPFGSDLSVEIDIEKNIKGEVVIDVLDMLGKIVQTQKRVVEGRRVSFSLPTDDLASGSYVIRMKNGNDTWQQKITKQ